MLLALYWICALISLVYVILVLIVGEVIDLGESVLEHVGNFFEGIGQALENIGVDPDTIGSLHDPGGSDDLSSDHGTHPSWLSFRMIMLFTGAFGAGGLVGVGAGLSSEMALIPAVSVGLVGGYILYKITDYLYSQQTFLTSNPEEYVGRIGQVTVSIPETGIGQVQLEVKLNIRKYPAKSADGSKIPLHSSVQVISFEGGDLTVIKI